MLPFHEIPFETHPSDENGYELFRELVWHNSEVCNSCMTMVRTVGPVIERQLETGGPRLLEHGLPLTMKINEWYKRTENGSQEHTTWDFNQRFGTCFCLNCGTDCNGNHRNKSLAELTPLVENIFRYTKRETPHEIDGKTFGREVKELKKDPDAQGSETEVMAIAFSRALKRDRPTANQRATAD